MASSIPATPFQENISSPSIQEIEEQLGTLADMHRISPPREDCSGDSESLFAFINRKLVEHGSDSAQILVRSGNSQNQQDQGGSSNSYFYKNRRILFLCFTGVYQYVEDENEGGGYILDDAAVEKFKAKLIDNVEDNDENERLRNIMKELDPTSDIENPTSLTYDTAPAQWLPRLLSGPDVWFDPDRELKHWNRRPPTAPPPEAGDKRKRKSSDHEGEECGTTDEEDNLPIHLLFHCSRIQPGQAVQCSSNCYIQAGLMLHAYRLMICGGTTFKRVTVPEFVRKLYSREAIYERIMRNKGGHATEVYRSLCKDGKGVKYTNGETPDEAFELIKEHKVGLVNHFRVTEDFEKDGKFSYEGRANIEHCGSHAMLCIGMRKDSSGVWWLLLQNWWEEKQFVEVTWDYLHSCFGDLRFYTKPVTLGVSAPLQLSPGQYWESQLQDGGDAESDDEKE